MSGGITVKEFKHIPGVNDAEYIKILEELNEINQRIINKAVAKIKMLSAQPETCEGCKHLGKWENEVEYGYPSPCTRCKGMQICLCDKCRRELYEKI